MAYPGHKLPGYMRWVYHGIVWAISITVTASAFATDAFGATQAYMLCAGTLARGFARLQPSLCLNTCPFVLCWGWGCVGVGVCMCVRVMCGVRCHGLLVRWFPSFVVANTYVDW